MPRPGQVLGLVGTNGIGKSTALRVLAGSLKPNLGRFNVRNNSSISEFALEIRSTCCLTFSLLQNPPDWQEILTYFRGSELQNYFTRILEDNLKVFASSSLFELLYFSMLGCIFHLLPSKCVNKLHCFDISLISRFLDHENFSS